MASSIEKPVIVLVQGSFQLPDAYYKLADALKALGYPVVQPPLPSLTDPDKPDFTSKSLADDAVAVRSEVRRLVEQGKRVVVVMHSYGGLVGNEAVTKNLSFTERQSSGLSGGVGKFFPRVIMFYSMHGCDLCNRVCGKICNQPTCFT